MPLAPVRSGTGPLRRCSHEECEARFGPCDVDHVYYMSKVYSPTDALRAELWVNFSERQETWRNHGSLPNLHRQAKRVRLSFDFPFYGHLLKEVTVATGGFIYTGEVMHQLLTATQYIAPLMANFDPSLSQNSSVFYFDNGTALVVQWSDIHLQDNSNLGPFTFQATLHKEGRIVFAYKQIPVDISLISTDHHPVRVGLSDAFVVLHQIEQIPNVRRKTIYEYHKVDILKSSISSCTGVEFFPLPTCLQFSSCGLCVSSQIGFNCSWCSRLQKCSSGFDRNRQDWVDHGCLDERRDPRCVQTSDPSFSLPSTQSTTSAQSAAGQHRGTTADPQNSTQGEGNTSHSNTSKRTVSTKQPPTENRGPDEVPDQVGLVVGVAVGTVVITAAVLLSLYVYIHPTSGLSLFFIERRPTRWPMLQFRRGSGRPSYAEVELTGRDLDSTVVIDPKQAFIISDRRESEQKEGFVVPDQRERFLLSDNS
ncbi:plexin domain-containing protein 2-like [Periophthalmus magnuspinnatus]|uniref:plexin domain-containing protein 2-like n=1 Tax=Periophthalmus magnuspinnatus TaxID=409849 RepID=UPI00145B300B|nr:plexin domain-containing protein 2-like [Periophthalmus magnuspinnatus]